MRGKPFYNKSECTYDVTLGLAGLIPQVVSRRAPLHEEKCRHSSERMHFMLFSGLVQDLHSQQFLVRYSGGKIEIMFSSSLSLVD